MQDAVNAVSNLLNANITGDLERASKAVVECTKNTKSFKGLVLCVDSITDQNVRELARGIVFGVVRTLDPTITDWNVLKKNIDAVISKAAQAILAAAFGQAPPQAPPA